jgi:F-box and WD-40 domain protein CDC4
VNVCLVVRTSNNPRREYLYVARIHGASPPSGRMSGQSPPIVMDQDDYFTPQQRVHRHAANVLIEDSDTDMAASATASSSRAAMFSSPAARKSRRMSRSGVPRPINTSTSPLNSMLPHNLLPSAPASPPTPAPSPTPTQRVPDWSTAAEYEDSHIKNMRARFSDMNRDERLRLLGELLNICGSQELSFVAEFVSPRLKKDPFIVLPTELSLRVSPLPAPHGMACC